MDPAAVLDRLGQLESVVLGARVVSPVALESADGWARLESKVLGAAPGPGVLQAQQAVGVRRGLRARAVPEALRVFADVLARLVVLVGVVPPAAGAPKGALVVVEREAILDPVDHVAPGVPTDHVAGSVQGVCVAQGAGKDE